MIAGSSAYASDYSIEAQTVALNHVPKLTTDVAFNNVYHDDLYSPFFVREDGVYVLFFIVSTDQSAQFTVFVNGQAKDLTAIGNNAGSGQLISRHLLDLKKDDAVIVRNYISNAGTMDLGVKIGGLNDSVNVSFLIHKIAPLPEQLYNYNCNKKLPDVDDKCLSKKHLYYYKKLKEKLADDCHLMLKGFDVHGTFFSKTQQTVALEAPVIFENTNVVNKITFVNNTSDIIIQQDGIYKAFFLVLILTQAKIENNKTS
jgi:hypothetical protein